MITENIEQKTMYNFFDLRHKSRKSQKALADLTCISTTVIVQIETFFEKPIEKRTVWRAATMDILADYFDVEVENITEFVAALELKAERRKTRAEKKKLELDKLKVETEEPTLELAS